MRIIGVMIIRHKNLKVYLARTKERVYRISSKQHKMARIGMYIGYLLNR